MTNGAAGLSNPSPVLGCHWFAAMPDCEQMNLVLL
jgi:hypothetical protein